MASVMWISAVFIVGMALTGLGAAVFARREGIPSRTVTVCLTLNGLLLLAAFLLYQQAQMRQEARGVYEPSVPIAVVLAGLFVEVAVLIATYVAGRGAERRR